MKLFSSAALCLALAATPALAQTPAPATPPMSHAAPIPGLCVLAQQAAVSNSIVGKAVGERMVQLEGQIRAELTALRTPLDRDIQAFQTASSTLTPEALNQQGTALEQRDAQFRQTAQTRAQQLELTQSKAIKRISDEMTPVVQQIYQARSCSILIDEGAILAGAPSMDITPDVVRGIDARIKSLTVELEQPQVAPPAAAAAAAPAARR